MTSYPANPGNECILISSSCHHYGLGARNWTIKQKVDVCIPSWLATSLPLYYQYQIINSKVYGWKKPSDQGKTGEVGALAESSTSTWLHHMHNEISCTDCIIYSSMAHYANCIWLGTLLIFSVNPIELQFKVCWDLNMHCLALSSLHCSGCFDAPPLPWLKKVTKCSHCTPTNTS